jgi:phosphatidylinositol-bisphosphatase
MEQVWYERGESRFSDHRPVNSLFSISLDGGSLQATSKACCPQGRTPPKSAVATTATGTTLRGGAVIEAEEMLVHLPRRRDYQCLHSSRF